MSEEEIRKQEEVITYQIFESYFKENSDLDNKEFYEKFPKVNQGTIRNWKAKAKKSVDKAETIPQVPPGSDKQMKTTIEALKITLKGRVPGFILQVDDLDLKSQFIVLTNAAKNLPEQKQANTPIIPIPLGGQKGKRVIDKYLTITPNLSNPKLSEINLEIPASVALNPEKNKKLGDWE